MGCGEPTLLSLYCDKCFRASFKKKPPKRKYTNPMTLMELDEQFKKLKKLMDSITANEK